ncbi:DUF3160 domain-containing protein [Reichenbachiella sp.]|uniref:DUF3160 domain-containing protein n=1 Tax=Reichenbachiella sp. TaxID=2184521 RepID=UPI003298AA0C
MKYLVITLISILTLACSPEKKESKSTDSIPKEPVAKQEPETSPEPEKVEEAPKLTVVVSNSKEELKRYYDLPHINEFYEYQMEMQYSEPDELQVPEDLSQLSYGDLRLLRNEVFARNGYLFSDGFLRGYFNRFKWYMPIFDVDTFRVVMSREEQDLVNAILTEEAKRKEETLVGANETDLYHADLVTNARQFKFVHRDILTDLAENNFSIVNAKRQMPFYVYDQNAYQYIPHYITIDLYLYILHKYFSCFLEKLDQNYMSKKLINLLTEVLKEVDVMKQSGGNQESLGWVEMYCKTALYAAYGTPMEVSLEYANIYQAEINSISAESGAPSFISNSTVNYSELKPRGHYTKTDELKKYFRTFKWISLNGIDLSDDKQLEGMISLAYIIKSRPQVYKIYKNYVSTMEKLAGEEDNVSIRDVIQAIEKIEDYNQAIASASLSSVRSQLSSLNKERIAKVFGKDFYMPESEIKRVYFLSSTYSISGEIFSKLIHVNGNKSKRPFPRGLDVPAVFGNETAEKIVVDEYKDAELWADYQPRLRQLQNQFDVFEGWEGNYGANALNTALAATTEKATYPTFMKTDAYNRKELSTMLSSWTHVKHDLILYQEKPYAAEAGQGGGPEPPKHYSYVEPNLAFWHQAIKFTKWLKSFSGLDGTHSDELQRILDVGLDLQTAAKLQIEGKDLPEELNVKLSRIGARIEYILLGLLETDHLPEREKSMALIADVYSYNGTNLNVAVGHADDIYVVVPIKGEYHMARGSVFSYYEFTDPTIYNDEEWKKMVGEENIKKRPKWMVPLINNIPSPKGQMEFRYPGHWMQGYYY